MRSCAIAVAIAAAACSSDPTLAVTVVNPEGIDVASTVITVYDTKTFQCEDIEYGNVDTGSLGAAQVATESIDADGKQTGSLAGLPRTDSKLIVALGEDSLGNVVTAGCVEKDTISGQDKIEIETVPAAVVSLALTDPTNDIYGIQVTLTDVTGKSIDNRPVWWRVYAAAGMKPDPAASTPLTIINDGIWEPVNRSCTKQGVTNIHPVPPNLVGGFEIEIRVAWATQPPQMFSSFTKMALTLMPLAPGLGVGAKFCTRHVAGSTKAVTCLNTVGGTVYTTDYSVTVANGTAALAKGMSLPVGSAGSASSPFGIFDVANGSNVDVLVANSDCSVTPAWGASWAHNATCSGSGSGVGLGTPTPNADDVLYVPACGSTSAKLLFHVPGTIVPLTPDSIFAIDLTSGASGAYQLPPGAITQLSFNSAGCVSELPLNGGAPTLRQVIVLDFGQPAVPVATRALYGCPTCVLSLPVPGGGVGFTTDAESRMLVPVSDASGAELSQDVLIPDPAGGVDHLVERSRQAAGAVPAQIATGNFDNDAGTDLVYDLVTAKSGTAFEISYAREVGDQPLSALSGLQAGINVEQLIVGDVSGDGYDDLVVAGIDNTMVAGSGSGSERRGVAVIPTRVAPPSVTLNPDTICTP